MIEFLHKRKNILSDVYMCNVKYQKKDPHAVHKSYQFVAAFEGIQVEGVNLLVSYSYQSTTWPRQAMPARTLLLSKSCWRETLSGRSALNHSFAILTFFTFLTTMSTGLPRCGAARFKVAGSTSLRRAPPNGSKGISACLVSKVSHVIPCYFSFFPCWSGKNM